MKGVHKAINPTQVMMQPDTATKSAALAAR